MALARAFLKDSLHGVEDVNEQVTSLPVPSSALRRGALHEASQDAGPRGVPLRADTGLRGHNTSIIAGREALEHPATEAWARLRGSGTPPNQIECLKETTPSLVYRLRKAGPSGGDVIAKQGRSETLRAELAIYQKVLVHLPVSTPHCYGLVEDGDGICWLFLEDAGEVVYSPEDKDHRRLAARWLARLHTSAAEFAAAAALPDRGVAHYLEHLHCGRERMLLGRANPALRPEDLAVLDELIAQCTVIESRWEEVKRLCRGMPQTLVHGDFVPKNIRLRLGQDGLILLAFDWETAGWGVPAVDLAQLSPALYWRFVREDWPHLGIRTVTRLAKAGKLLGRLAAVDWAAHWLKYQWVERPMGWLAVYRDDLAVAVELLAEGK